MIDGVAVNEAAPELREALASAGFQQAYKGWTRRPDRRDGRPGGGVRLPASARAVRSSSTTTVAGDRAPGPAAAGSSPPWRRRTRRRSWPA